MQPEVWPEIHETGGIYLQNHDTGEITGYPGQTRGEILKRFGPYRLPDSIGEDGWWNRGRENFAEAQGRAIGIASILRQRANENKRIGIVSHGALISLLLQALSGGLPNENIYYDHYNTSITRLSFPTPDHLTVVYQNRVDHLPDELVTGVLSWV